jgi:hypothetical protein
VAKSLIALRKRHVALRRGGFERLCMDVEDGCYAFARTHPQGSVAVLLNASPDERHYCIAAQPAGWQEGRCLHDLLRAGREYLVSEGCFELTLPPWSGTLVA